MWDTAAEGWWPLGSCAGVGLSANRPQYPTQALCTLGTRALRGAGCALGCSHSTACGGSAAVPAEARKQTPSGTPVGACKRGANTMCKCALSPIFSWQLPLLSLTTMLARPSAVTIPKLAGCDVPTCSQHIFPSTMLSASKIPKHLPSTHCLPYVTPSLCPTMQPPAQQAECQAGVGVGEGEGLQCVIPALLQRALRMAGQRVR